MENKNNYFRKMFKKIGKGYMRLVRLLGRINTIIILTVIYFALMPLFYLFMLVFKKDLNTESRWKIKQPFNRDSHEFQS